MTEHERDPDRPNPEGPARRGERDAAPEAGGDLRYSLDDSDKPYIDLLASIASDISDGIRVAWDQHQQVPNRIKQRIEILKALEKIAEAHRGSENADRASLGGDTTRASDTSTTIELPMNPGKTRSRTEVLATWGPLTILSALGQGGFGEVYCAHDPKLERDVALKILRKDRSMSRRDVKLFLDEGRRLARIRHENVLTVHGADEHEGRPGLWTDLVQGRDLKEWIVVHGPLSAAEAAHIGVVLCRALAALHSAGLVHRDIKPANVMRERGGRIILMDLGAATDQHTTDDAQATIGTPLFMSPEQLLDDAAATSQSDLFALGILLYWLVSAKHPIEADSMYELRQKHKRRELVPLRDVRADIPPMFAQVVDKALRAELDERFKSAGEMEASLARCAEVLPEDSTLKPPVVPAPRQRRLRRAAATAGVSLVLALAFVIGRSAFQSSLAVDAVLHVTQGDEVRALQAGDEIRVSDPIHLTVLGSKSMHIYVMNEDAAGDLTVLFPAEGCPPNPLGAHEEHRLPHRTGSWEVTSSGGREMFLVVASEQPVEDLEGMLEELPHAQRSPRGLQRILDVPDAENGRLLPVLARRYQQRARQDRGLWAWEIEMQNVGNGTIRP